MDFEPYFKVYNMVSVELKSIKLGQMTTLNVIFHVVLSIYRLVKIWNSPQFPARFRNGRYLGAVYMILNRVWSGMKKKRFGTMFTWKCYRTKSYSNEAQLSREPAKGQQKTKEKQDYACADRDVSRSCSGMNFDLRLYDSGIGLAMDWKFRSRTRTQCKLDPEWLHFCSGFM